MWDCGVSTQSWPSMCLIYVCDLPREENIHKGWKKMIKQLVGLLNAATGVFHLSGRGKKGGGLMVEYTPTRRIQKLWACMFWMLRRTTYFSCVLSALLFSPAAATQQIWGLRAAESSSGPMRECYKARYLCSLAPGSTDYQGRDQDQVQLLGQKQDPPHVSVFSQSSPTSAMCSVFSWFLTYPGTWSPCAPIMENMQM